MCIRDSLNASLNSDQPFDFANNFIILGHKSYGGPAWDQYGYTSVNIDDSNPAKITATSQLTGYMDVRFATPRKIIHMISVRRDDNITNQSTLTVAPPVEVR